MYRRLPPLRQHAISALTTSLRITRRRAAPLEQKCWSTGLETYPVYIRRVCTGMTFEEATVVLEPYEAEDEAVTVAQGDLQCGKCKSRRVHRVEMQTRSADESATVFCQCADCGSRWKF